jgi:L-aspartate aminotransferase apoenzyme (EC 2.6.1.1)/phosphoserine aminotransferase apoenzyme (EC 2.6.1.52)
VDMVVSGSQKGLMLPPGLGFISVSPKAWKLIEASKSPKYYFSLKAAKKAIDKTDTPYTPAIGLIIALVESLKMIKTDGLSNVFAYYSKLAKATREAAKALGLRVYAKGDCSSDAITAIEVPAGVDGEKMVKTMRDVYHVTIAGGQAELKGKVFRIAHMGYINEFDLITAISCLEKVLKEMGYNFQLGAGVAAAQKIINS